jgi:ankyrin repeat protein
MKSTKLQLLVTLAAVVTAAALFAAKGLPPRLGMDDALGTMCLDEVVRNVRWGANAGSRGSCGYTPLHLAAFYGNVKAAALCVDRGADLNATAGSNVTLMPITDNRTGERMTRVYWFTAEDNHELFSDTPLHWAAFQGHEPMVRWLVEHGADINAGSARDFGDKPLTPLRLALGNGHRAVAEWLRQHGAKE